MGWICGVGICGGYSDTGDRRGYNDRWGYQVGVSVSNHLIGGYLEGVQEQISFHVSIGSQRYLRWGYKIWVTVPPPEVV